MPQDTRNSLLACIALVMVVFSIGFHRIRPAGSETMLNSIQQEHEIQNSSDRMQRNDRHGVATAQSDQKKIKNMLSVVFLMPFASGKGGL